MTARERAREAPSAEDVARPVPDETRAPVLTPSRSVLRAASAAMTRSKARLYGLASKIAAVWTQALDGERRPALERLARRARMWRSVVQYHPLTPVLAGVLAVVVLLGVGGGALLFARPESYAAPAALDGPAAALGPVAAEPGLEFGFGPETLRDISEDEARSINAAMPFSKLPILDRKSVV